MSAARRTRAILLGSAWLASGCWNWNTYQPCVGPDASLDYCATLPRLTAPPVLDGIADCDLPAAALGQMQGAGAAHATAVLAAAWRPDGLYVFVQVVRANTERLHPPVASDGTLANGDSVEVYVDSDGVFQQPGVYDTQGTRQFTFEAPSGEDAQPPPRSASYDRTTRMPEAGPTRFVSRLTPNGYAVEAFLSADDLRIASWPLAVGGRIGLDIAVNVGDADAGVATRDGELYLRLDPALVACDGRPYCDTAAFCTPQLLPSP